MGRGSRPIKDVATERTYTCITEGEKSRYGSVLIDEYGECGRSVTVSTNWSERSDATNGSIRRDVTTTKYGATTSSNDADIGSKVTDGNGGTGTTRSNGI